MSSSFATAPQPQHSNHNYPSAAQHRAEAAQLKAFTKSSGGPKTTFPLVLASVTIATLSMTMDAVQRYSTDAFIAGIMMTILLALTVGVIVDQLKTSPKWRLAATLILPTAFGAVIGMVVQALVLHQVGTSWTAAVKDLGGLVDTTEPVAWIASGIVLGGLPALLVTVFLLLTARAARKIIGHDASEGFGVAFTGGVGLLSGLGLVLVDGVALPPLVIVTILSTITLLVTLLVDASRVRFLRKVYAGTNEGYDIVPADRFASDPSLAPMVANAGSQYVLVRVDNKLGSYRSCAATPIALVASTEDETLRPLLRRRTAATVMVVAMAVLGGLSMLTTS